MNALKKKLGPLPLWQWVLIGAVVGVGSILYRRGHPAAAAAAAVTPSDAQYNPIDPTTGLPYSGGVSAGAPAAVTGDVTAPQSLSDLLSGFGQLTDLLGQIQSLQPGPEIQADNGAVQEQTGAGGPGAVAKKKAGVFTQSEGKRAGLNYIVQGGKRRYESTAGKGDWGKGGVIKVASRTAAKKKTAAAKKNPGHTTTKHGGGKKTPSSSAAHNARQHHNVRPPSHQRHAPTQHHSAAHPAAKRPAPKPPARRRPVARHR